LFKYALWADRITKKRATGKSPFELVYGLDVVLPVNLRLPVYKLLGQFLPTKRLCSIILIGWYN
jgi:hypothetical protein